MGKGLGRSTQTLTHGWLHGHPQPIHTVGKSLGRSTQTLRKFRQRMRKSPNTTKQHLFE
jgi:hypothetical protein